MKQFINFIKDDSGAVTVDWVVLTAAIVGIAIAVITLISGGVETASEGIDEELQVAGTGWNFLNTPSTTLDEYVSDFVDIRNDSGQFNDTSTLNQDIFDNINADSPTDYAYTGSVDGGGFPIYASSDVDVFDGNGDYTGSTNTNTLSINGEVVNQIDYEGAVIQQEAYFPEPT